MKTTRYLIVVLFLFALSMTACKKNESKVTEQEAQSPQGTAGRIQYSLQPDLRKWKVVSDDTQEQMRITQYILDEEQPEKASELFSVVEMTDVNITPSEYFSQFITELQKRYTHVKVESKIINQKTNSLMGEWWIDGKSPDNTQHEWIRIIKKGNDIAILRYSTTHPDKLEKTRKVWETILNNASF